MCIAMGDWFCYIIDVFSDWLTKISEDPRPIALSPVSLGLRTFADKSSNRAMCFIFWVAFILYIIIHIYKHINICIHIVKERGIVVCCS